MDELKENIDVLEARLKELEERLGVIGNHLTYEKASRVDNTDKVRAVFDFLTSTEEFNSYYQAQMVMQETTGRWKQ